jgi:hypothetical protein
MGRYVGEAPPSKRSGIPKPEEIQLKLSDAMEAAAESLRSRLIYDINQAKLFPVRVPSEKGNHVMAVLAEFAAARWQVTTIGSDWLIDFPKGK